MFEDSDRADRLIGFESQGATEVRSRNVEAVHQAMRCKARASCPRSTLSQQPYGAVCREKGECYETQTRIKAGRPRPNHNTIVR